MFDVRSLLDDLLRGDPPSHRQIPRDEPDTGTAALPAWFAAVGPQSAQPTGAGVPAPGERRPPERAEGGEGRPSGTAAPGFQETRPGGGGEAAEAAGAPPAPASPVSHREEGGLGDLVGKLEQQARAGGGGLLEVLGQALGQAVGGVRKASGRLDAATGASQHAREAIEQMTGRSPEELVAELKALVANNQLAAGATLGGLGALILGTPAGRQLAATAAKLGGLALIGGLAYRALQAYQEGRPVLPNAPPQGAKLAAAPAGSGFEPDALSPDRARLLIRTMIAAAAADGRIDQSERQRILGNLRQARASPEAQRFLMQEVQRPAAVVDLVREVSSPAQATEVYTAARIAVDLDSEEEHAFLKALAEQLGIDARLAAHIDAVARGASA